MENKFCLEEINKYVDIYLQDKSQLLKCRKLSQPFIEKINNISMLLEKEHNKSYELQTFRDFIRKRIRWNEEQKEKLKIKKHKNRNWDW